MRRKQISIKVIIFILICIPTISISVSIDTNALEDKIINVTDSMDINEYKMSKGSKLTRKSNLGRSLLKILPPKDEIIGEIKQGLINLQRNINLNSYIEYFKDVDDYKVPMNYFFDTLNEYPEIFYPNLTITCSYGCNTSTNEITSYSLLVTYQYDNNTINNMRNKFNEKIDYIKNNYLLKAKSHLEEEYIIHDYIIKNCRYDYENLRNLPIVDHTSYGALVNGVAVCDGYSKGAKVLFDLCKIESGIVDSEIMNHAWNYVNIEGNYYNLDITWDDKDIEDNIDYSYFNISNKGISIGDNPHIWNSLDYPSCVNEKFDFLRDGNVYIRKESELYVTKVIDRIDEVYTRNLDGGNFKRKVLEDLNDDGVVDIIDIAIAGDKYNSIYGQAIFNDKCDFNKDGIIDMYDIAVISRKVS